MSKAKVIIGAAIVLSSGCAFSARTVGMRDPIIEVVKSLSESQAAGVKALTDALSKADFSACGVAK